MQPDTEKQSQFHKATSLFLNICHHLLKDYPKHILLMDIYSTNFSLICILHITQHCEYYCCNSKQEYVSSL